MKAKLVSFVVVALLILPVSSFAGAKPKISNWTPTKYRGHTYLINTKVRESECKNSSNGFWYDGSCNACPVGKHYNEKTGQCECLAGFLDNGKGLSCRCPANTTVMFDAKGPRCFGAEKLAVEQEQKLKTATPVVAAPAVDKPSEATPVATETPPCPINTVCTNLVPLSHAYLDFIVSHAKAAE